VRRVRTVVGDRNFDSKMSRELLAGRGITNAIAPRDAGLLRARLREAQFQQLQQRRGQTEARIVIFKNAFLERRFWPKVTRIRGGWWPGTYSRTISGCWPACPSASRAR